MIATLWLLLLQGILGAFDTVYYHAWRARLHAHREITAPELKLHAARDFIYAIMFFVIPNFECHGAFAWALIAMMISEITITVFDFAIEPRVRQTIGGVPIGERVTHACLGFVYLGFVAAFAPHLLNWVSVPTAIVGTYDQIPSLFKIVFDCMAVGVFISGIRDSTAFFVKPYRC